MNTATFKTTLSRLLARVSPHAAGLIVLLLCLLSLSLKVYIRYETSYLFFGDPTSATPTSDARSWNLHAMNLAEGRGFGDFTKLFESRNFVPPGHPFLMSIFYGWFGYRPDIAGWGVALLGALLPWITFLLTAEMFGRRAGCWAALLAAIYHPFAMFGFTLMSEPSVILATAIALWLWSRICRTQRRRDAILAGLVFGAAALVRPSALAFLFGCGLATLLLSTTTKRKLQLAGLLLVSAAILPSLWQVRNAAVHGERAFVYSSALARRGPRTTPSTAQASTRGTPGIVRSGSIPKRVSSNAFSAYKAKLAHFAPRLQCNMRSESSGGSVHSWASKDLGQNPTAPTAGLIPHGSSSRQSPCWFWAPQDSSRARERLSVTNTLQSAVQQPAWSGRPPLVLRWHCLSMEPAYMAHRRAIASRLNMPSSRLRALRCSRSKAPPDTDGHGPWSSPARIQSGGCFWLDVWGQPSWPWSYVWS